jgi:hypothetical protein
VVAALAASEAKSPAGVAMTATRRRARSAMSAGGDRIGPPASGTRSGPSTGRDHGPYQSCARATRQHAAQHGGAGDPATH